MDKNKILDELQKRIAIADEQCRNEAVNPEGLNLPSYSKFMFQREALRDFLHWVNWEFIHNPTP